MSKDKLTKKQRSLNMSKVKSKNTKLEYKIRRVLHKLGFRFRVNFNLFGKPDIVFPKKKIAIFINGCFWHQHGCRKSKRPETNKDFWNKKLDRNIERDSKVKDTIQGLGWKCIYIWQCEVEKNFQQILDSLINILRPKI